MELNYKVRGGMKLKKVKVISLIIISIFLFDFTKVFASDTHVDLIIDKTIFKPGDTITVTLNATCEDGLGFVGTEIKYDKKVLTLQSQTIEKDWVNYGKDKLELFINTTNKITNSEICVLVFKVNDEASEGISKITTSKIEISDKNNKEYSLNEIEKAITIKKEENNEKDNEESDKTDNSENQGGSTDNKTDNEKQENSTENKTDDEKQENYIENKADGEANYIKNKFNSTTDNSLNKNYIPKTGKENVIKFAIIITILLSIGFYIKYINTKI